MWQMLTALPASSDPSVLSFVTGEAAGGSAEFLMATHTTSHGCDVRLPLYHVHGGYLPMTGFAFFIRIQMDTMTEENPAGNPRD